jgi:hypothetical protein
MKNLLDGKEGCDTRIFYNMFIDNVFGIHGYISRFVTNDAVLHRMDWF